MQQTFPPPSLRLRQGQPSSQHSPSQLRSFGQHSSGFLHLPSQHFSPSGQQRFLHTRSSGQHFFECGPPVQTWFAAQHVSPHSVFGGQHFLPATHFFLQQMPAPPLHACPSGMRLQAPQRHSSHSLHE